MGCSSGNCHGNHGNWIPSIFPADVPPKGGWTLKGLLIDARIPPEVQTSYRDATWPGQRWNEPLDGIFFALERAGVQLTNGLRQAIRQWANEIWKARDPSRVVEPRPQFESFNGPAPEIAPKMRWSRNFWELANLALTGDSVNLQVIQALKVLARVLLSGPQGCPACENHFETHLAAFPVENIHSLTQARVWLWHIHNLAKPMHQPVPYATIAEQNGWTPLSANAVKSILQKLKAETAALAA